MNERIKELAEQAYKEVIKNTPSFLVTKESYEQKFAELIVRECAKQAYREELTVEEGMMRYRCILEHFGVEE